jgi:stearoyl-CoA desaturase (delta-9 desaturase)
MSQEVIPQELAPAANGQSRAGDARQIPHPESATPLTIYRSYAFTLAVLHLIALLAFVPYFFSWSGVLVGVLGHFLFGMCGITIGYHRLLTHRGFRCPLWLEHTLAILGLCNLQDSPARWVAIHRMHHQHSDHQPDPHSPLVNFLWSHVGWVIYRNRNHDEVRYFERYVRDLLRDPFYLRLERSYRWLLVYLAHAAVISALGGLWGWWQTGSFGGTIQMAYSWLVWGVVVRTVLVLHGTWAVNSVAHVWGYRNYETRDNSRNNWLVALLSHGEGWHNNHHASPRAARHGHRWYELDMSWWVIVLLEKLGLVTDVVRPQQSGKEQPQPRAAG